MGDARNLASVTDAGTARAAGPRPLRLAGGALAGLLILVAGLLAGTGWLYVLRGLRWLGVGPRIADSLPLLQLASGDGQPLLRVLLAWVLAGVLTGVALADKPAGRRAAVALVVALLVLLIDSQVSYSLARNLAFTDVVFARTPGLGPVLEAAAFALGCWLPRPVNRRNRPGPRRRSLIAIVSGLDDRGLRARQDGQAAQDDADRQQVGDGRTGATA
jgi:hypothetical protein